MKGKSTMNSRKFKESMDFCGCETNFGDYTITVLSKISPSESGSILAEIDTSSGYPEHVQFHVDNLREHYRSGIDLEGERKFDWYIPAHQFVNLVFTFILTNQESKYTPPTDCEDIETIYDFDEIDFEEMLTSY